jgi:hypothetical protein
MEDPRPRQLAAILLPSPFSCSFRVGGEPKNKKGTEGINGRPSISPGRGDIASVPFFRNLVILRRYCFRPLFLYPSRFFVNSSFCGDIASVPFLVRWADALGAAAVHSGGRAGWWVGVGYFLDVD